MHQSLNKKTLWKVAGATYQLDVKNLKGALGYVYKDMASIKTKKMLQTFGCKSRNNTAAMFTFHPNIAHVAKQFTAKRYVDVYDVSDAPPLLKAEPFWIIIKWNNQW